MEGIERHVLNDGKVMFRVNVQRGERSVVIFIGSDQAKAEEALKRYRARKGLSDDLWGQSQK